MTENSEVRDNPGFALAKLSAYPFVLIRRQTSSEIRKPHHKYQHVTIDLRGQYANGTRSSKRPLLCTCATNFIGIGLAKRSVDSAKASGETSTRAVVVWTEFRSVLGGDRISDSNDMPEISDFPFIARAQHSKMEATAGVTHELHIWWKSGESHWHRFVISFKHRHRQAKRPTLPINPPTNESDRLVYHQLL